MSSHTILLVFLFIIYVNVTSRVYRNRKTERQALALVGKKAVKKNMDEEKCE